MYHLMRALDKDSYQILDLSSPATSFGNHCSPYYINRHFGKMNLDLFSYYNITIALVLIFCENLLYSSSPDQKLGYFERDHLYLAFIRGSFILVEIKR